ncbi:DNA replication licensing factor MCM3, putative (MCM3), partial [Plasmodium ovale curtisi]
VKPCETNENEQVANNEKGVDDIFKEVEAKLNNKIMKEIEEKKRERELLDLEIENKRIFIYNEREVNNNNNNDPNNSQDNEEFETPIFANRDEMIYYDKDGVEHEILTVPFFKKYLHYVKNVFYNEKQRTDGWKPYPEVSDEACEVITELYADLREKAAKYSHNKIIQGVTPRTLEAIIRIASSHAKLKLNRYVTSVDVNYAKKLLMYTLFGEEIVESEDEYEEDEEEEDYEDDDDEEYVHKPINKKNKTKAKKRTAEKQTTSRKKNKTNKSKDNQDDNLMIDDHQSASTKATPLDVREIERLIVENVTLNDPGDGLRDEALLDL